MTGCTPLSLQERGLAILGGFDRARRTVAAGIEGMGGLGSAEVRRDRDRGGCAGRRGIGIRRGIGLPSPLRA